MLSEHRDIAAAKRFFIRAIERHGAPERITLDGYPAAHAAVAELKVSGVIRPETKIWASKYLNNSIEQDHRRVKQRVYPMLSFKKFANASVTISGIELVQKFKKGQFDTTKLTNRAGWRVPPVWEAVLNA
jgi:transposase-like protein